MVKEDGEVGLLDVICNRDLRATLVERLDNFGSLRSSASSCVSPSTNAPAPIRDSLSRNSSSAKALPRLTVGDVHAGFLIRGLSSLLWRSLLGRHG
jgi:hypothetical protein